MNEVMEILEKLGLSCYAKSFVAEGFDTWDTLSDITESDLNDLNVKLGHRRKLQRAIAEHRHESRNLASPESLSESFESSATVRGSIEPHQSRKGRTDGPDDAVRTKRKYRRHPKPDINAPERPPSAYVIFSNHMRVELKEHDYSFTEMAKVVGEKWQELAADARERYERQASSAKERYNAEMAIYKKTENFSRYAEYLAAFKARNGGTETAEGKRIRLNNETSASTQDSPDAIDIGLPTRRKSVASTYSVTSTPSESNTAPEAYSAATSPSTRFFSGVQSHASRERPYSHSHADSPTSTNTPLPMRNVAANSLPLDSRYFCHPEPPPSAFSRPRSVASPTSPLDNSPSTLPSPRSQNDSYKNRPLHLNGGMSQQPRTSSSQMSFTAMMDVDSPRSRRILPAPLLPVSGASLVKPDLRPISMTSSSRSGSERVEDVRGSLAVLLRAGEWARDAETNGIDLQASRIQR